MDGKGEGKDLGKQQTCVAVGVTANDQGKRRSSLYILVYYNIAFFSWVARLIGDVRKIPIVRAVAEHTCFGFLWVMLGLLFLALGNVCVVFSLEEFFPGLLPLFDLNALTDRGTVAFTVWFAVHTVQVMVVMMGLRVRNKPRRPRGRKLKLIVDVTNICSAIMARELLPYNQCSLWASISWVGYVYVVGHLMWPASDSGLGDCLLGVGMQKLVYETRGNLLHFVPVLLLCASIVSSRYASYVDHPITVPAADDKLILNCNKLEMLPC